MSNDDELERLLREVDASLSGGSVATPKGGDVARRQSQDGPATPARSGGALRTGTIAGAVCGGAVFVGTVLVSWLPGDQAPFQSGVGAFVGAFVTGAFLSMRRRS